MITHFKPVLNFLVNAILSLLSIILLLGCKASENPSKPLLVEQSTLVYNTPVVVFSETSTVSVSKPAPTTKAASFKTTVPATFDFQTHTPPPTRTPTVTPTPTVTSSPTFTRTVMRSPSPVPSSTITLPVSSTPTTDGIIVSCTTTWFFIPVPEGCADTDPFARVLVYQAFEDGFMIGLANERVILVFYHQTATSTWEAIPDTFIEGMPLEDITIIPPAGFFEPARGFGKVWRENPKIQEYLGWATIPEIGYTGFSQVDITTGIRYVQGHDGKIYRLSKDHWEQIN